MSLFVVAAVAVGAAGCGDNDSEIGATGAAGGAGAGVAGAAGAGGIGSLGGQVVPGTVSGDIVSLPVSLNGASAQPFVVDTGSPITLVDPARYPTMALANGAGATIDVGAVHLQDVPVIAASPCGVMMCTSTAPAGLLGGQVLQRYDVFLDYKSQFIGFDLTSIPGGFGPPTTIAFALEGGGLVVMPPNATVTVPATRIAVDVTIEGTTYPFVVDTGSSQVLLRPEIFAAVVSDGRAQGTANVLTVNGTVSEPTTQLETVSLGAATQTDVAAVSAPFSLDPLSSEVGHTVDGLLGGSFLSSYLVSIDFPNRQITLWPNQ